MSDLLFQQLSSVNNGLQPVPPTIASAATISPQTFITFVTGTVQVATITPFVSGAHLLVLVFTDASPGALVTTGNIKRAITPVQNIPALFFYDPVTALYWPAKLT